jgi:hypothetical protein
MTTFDDRKDSFEKKFAHDEELRFRAMARRNKRLGMWAAGLLGKTGEDAETYAKSVVLADFKQAGDEDVLEKVQADLEAAGKATPPAEIRRKMDELLAVAVDDIKAGR